MASIESAQRVEAEASKASGTSSHLMDGLETLGQEVGEAVQDAGTAIGGTVEGARTAVTDTVATVKAGMSETVDTVKGAFISLRHALDVRDHVRRHPWLMLSVAAFLGYVVGIWVNRPRRESD